MFHITEELIAKMNGMLNDLSLKPYLQSTVSGCSGCSGSCSASCEGFCSGSCRGGCDTQVADGGGLGW